MVKSSKTAKLILDGNEFDLPVMSPTAGPDVLDIRNFMVKLGYLHMTQVLPQLLVAIVLLLLLMVAKENYSSRLSYRSTGRAFALFGGLFSSLYGNLPTPAELEDFENRVTNHTMIHEQMGYLFRGFRRDAHPMAIMTGVVGAMSAFYHDSTDITDPWQREVASIRMIAKMPTIAQWLTSIQLANLSFIPVTI